MGEAGPFGIEPDNLHRPVAKLFKYNPCNLQCSPDNQDDHQQDEEIWKIPDEHLPEESHGLANLIFNSTDQFAALQEFQFGLSFFIEPDNDIHRHDSPEAVFNGRVILESSGVFTKVPYDLGFGLEPAQSVGADQGGRQTG